MNVSGSTGTSELISNSLASFCGIKLWLSGSPSTSIWSTFAVQSSSCRRQWHDLPESQISQFTQSSWLIFFWSFCHCMYSKGIPPYNVRYHSHMAHKKFNTTWLKLSCPMSILFGMKRQPSSYVTLVAKWKWSSWSKIGMERWRYVTLFLSLFFFERSFSFLFWKCQSFMKLWLKYLQLTQEPCSLVCGKQPHNRASFCWLS